MKTIKIIVIVTFYFLLFTFHCFSQDWQWAKHIGSSVRDYGSCTSDKFGYIYITCGGGFSSSQLPPPNCDNNVPFYSVTDTLQSANQQNVYFVKLDSSGNQIWIKQFSWSVYNSMCSGSIGQPVYDSINNVVYIYGIFKGTITLGSIQLVASSVDMYIAQFDTDGNCIWAKQAGSTGDNEYISALSVDKFGNVYICGNNDNNASFDSFIVPYGSFLAKYSSIGTCLWAYKKINRPIPSTYLVSLKVNDTSVCVTGLTKGTLIADTITTTYSSSWYPYLAAFDLDGNVKKLKTFGVGSRIRGNIGIDSIGNFYITGYFGGLVYFDSISVSSGSQSDLFFAKLDKNWNFKWVKQILSSDAMGFDVVTDKAGYSYFTGYFYGTVSFGNYNATASSGGDMFLTRYDTNGFCNGILFFGNSSIGYSITIDNTGSPVVVGTFVGGIIGSNTFPHYGQYDVFIAKAYPINTGINDLKISQNNLLTIYANPNDGNCNITVPDEFQNEKKLILKIFDTKGNQIQQAQVEMLNDKIKVSIEAEAKGIYNAILTNGKKSYSGKIIFE